MVRFAERNYFVGITVDSMRSQAIGRVVRAYADTIANLKDIREARAQLPKRRRALRALLRTDEERQRFDRNVKERRLP